MTLEELVELLMIRALLAAHLGMAAVRRRLREEAGEVLLKAAAQLGPVVVRIETPG